MTIQEWALSAAFVLPAIALSAWMMLLRKEIKDEEYKKKED